MRGHLASQTGILFLLACIINGMSQCTYTPYSLLGNACTSMWLPRTLQLVHYHLLTNKTNISFSGELKLIKQVLKFCLFMHSLMFSFWFTFQISILDIKYYLKRKCFCLFLCNSFCSNFHYKLLVKFNQDGVIKNIVKILKSIIDKFMDYFFNKNFTSKFNSYLFFSPNDQANKKTPSKSNGKRPSSADNNKTESSACVLQ